MARVEVPAWTPHPDVWLLVGALVCGYVIAAMRLGPRFAPDPRRPLSRLQQTALAVGALAILVASDWPVHDVAEDYFFSVHMLQHFTYTTVVPNPYVQLNFSYGNSVVTGNVIILSRTASTAASFYNPPEQSGISDAFLNFLKEKNVEYLVFVSNQESTPAKLFRRGALQSYDPGQWNRSPVPSVRFSISTSWPRA